MNMKSILSQINFVTHNQDPNIEIAGTAHTGSINATYAELCAVFGPPIKETERPKVHAEWHVQFGDGVVGTIYDWRSGGAVESVKLWHVGGKVGTTDARDRIETILLGHRESVNDSKPKTREEEFIKTVVDPQKEIIESVRMKFGENGVLMAEHTAAMHRIEAMITFMVKALLSGEPMNAEDGAEHKSILPAEALKIMMLSAQQQFITMSGLMARASNLHDLPYDSGRELMDMGRRIMEAERNGVFAMAQKHAKEQGEG